MAVGNPYSRIIEKMRDEGAYKNGFQLETAKVINVKPLSISYNNVSISRNIHSSLLTSTVKIEDITKKEENISSELKEVLNSLYNMVKLNKGDTVIVQRVENNFYILGKV